MAVLTLRQAVKHINGGLEALPDKRRPIGPKTLKKLAEDGGIPALPFGRSWTFTSESMLRNLASSQDMRDELAGRGRAAAAELTIEGNIERWAEAWQLS